MGFKDTGWIELRSITLLFGRNSSGKSAIIRAILLLRQSLGMSAKKADLVLNGVDVDFGSYQNTIHRHEIFENITFAFRLEREVDDSFSLNPLRTIEEEQQATQSEIRNDQQADGWLRDLALFRFSVIALQITRRAE